MSELSNNEKLFSYYTIPKFKLSNQNFLFGKFYESSKIFVHVIIAWFWLMNILLLIVFALLEKENVNNFFLNLWNIIQY